MRFPNIDSNYTGDINELKVLVKLKELGYVVLKDTSNASRTDLVIRCEGNRYLNIQVKTIRITNKCPNLSISTSGGKRDLPYSKYDVDFFIGVSGDNFYVVPYEVAYRGNDVRVSYYPSREYFNAWSLIPAPFNKLEPVLEVINNQEVMNF